MWCSINQPMPDSHTVESISASKENLTCEGNGLMLVCIANSGLIFPGISANFVCGLDSEGAIPFTAHSALLPRGSKVHR